MGLLTKEIEVKNNVCHIKYTIFGIKFSFKFSKEEIEIKDKNSLLPCLFPISLSTIEKEKLVEKFKKSKHYLEFGAGGSTFLCAINSNAKIVSIEADKNWISYIKKWKILNSKNIDIRYVDIGEVKRWSYPVNEDKIEYWQDYSKKVFEDKKVVPDLIFIDGRFRIACALQSILNCPNNTVIMIHDYPDRTNYHILEEFLDIVEVCDNLAIFNIKKNCDFQKVLMLYEKYKNDYE